MQKVLVIDDDQDILDLITFNLTRAGMQCTCATDSLKGLEIARREEPDLIVLDIMLPGTSGIEILKQLKYDSATKQTPVIMLTAKTEEVDRVLGLELGADDYVTKPFSVRELVLRIQRILARVDQQDEGVLLQCNGITLDCDRYEVRVQGDQVKLTNTEFNLLAFLLRNKSRVLSRDRLLENVWGYRYGGTTRTVDTHIQRLRDKLGREGNCIETVRGVGYKLEPVTSRT
jgi:two-component system phosphate regulon response regulator PhoB